MGDGVAHDANPGQLEQDGERLIQSFSAFDPTGHQLINFVVTHKRFSTQRCGRIRSPTWGA